MDGTPADRVALGSHHWGDVDLVLSGITGGSNLGNATWHPGTLAPAKQATLLGEERPALVNVNLPERPQGLRRTTQDRAGTAPMIPTCASVGRSSRSKNAKNA